MTYKCGKCGEMVKELPPGIIRCPACANKILYKTRDPIAKDIKAR